MADRNFRDSSMFVPFLIFVSSFVQALFQASLQAMLPALFQASFQAFNEEAWQKK